MIKRLWNWHVDNLSHSFVYFVVSGIMFAGVIAYLLYLTLIPFLDKI